MSTTTTRTLVIERQLAHPPEKVWRALTEQSALDAWLMGKGEFRPVVGQAFTRQADPMPHWDGVVSGEILEVVAPSRLVYSWASAGVNSVVTFTLAPEGDGTKLRFEMAGIPDMAQAYMGAEYGWNAQLDAMTSSLAS